MQLRLRSLLRTARAPDREQGIARPPRRLHRGDVPRRCLPVTDTDGEYGGLGTLARAGSRAVDHSDAAQARHPSRLPQEVERARRSASLRKAGRPSSSAFLTVLVIDPSSARASRPLHDSSVKTRVVSPSKSIRQTCTALMPSVRPFHATLCGRSLSTISDRIVPGPAFQLNVVPTRTGSSTCIVFTPGIHWGHVLRSVSVSQTTSGRAPMTISPDSQTGALCSASKVDLPGGPMPPVSRPQRPARFAHRHGDHRARRPLDSGHV